ncbi:glycosyltransferase [Paenibacillus sp. FSL R7-0216]|uniref:glycosyltransferase family 2 protein n=1 Tax=Paenibacillus sp. FSL R7-0216 TaxID=2921677 RepID=UPI0030DBB146
MKTGVSIITCTKRRNCMDTLFRNYARQEHPHKELIVILNHPNLRISEYELAARRFPNVRIVSVPDSVSLGACLNLGVKLAKHPLIAKFDDDDYYAPRYLTDSVRILRQTKADIVGKRAHYMQLSGEPRLLFRYPAMAGRYVPLVQGATLLVRRRVFKQVRFPDRSRGECVRFCASCRAKGFKIYAGSPRHFLAIRQRNSKDHTWIVSDKALLKRNVRLLEVDDARQFVGGT